MKKYLLVIMVVLGIALSGCGSNYEGDLYNEEPGFNDENTNLESPNPVIDEIDDQGGDAVTNDNAAPALEDRKIIYRANLEMAVINPTSVYNDVLQTIDSYTAYIEEADITTNTYEITIRVLSSEFDEFIEDLKTSGELVAYSKTSDDITNSYSTFEARKLALETRHDRILELITAAEDLDTILLLEEERFEIEAELNLIGTKLANYDSLVDYSTVTLKIKEAIEEIIVLPRTQIPGISSMESTKNSISLELYNGSDENVTIHVDVYLNGEFITEYEENTFAESRVMVTFNELKSNREYTFKITSLAAEHRVSLVDTIRVETEKTYGNKTSNTFIDSVNLLVMMFEFIGLAITGILPFAVVAGVIYIPIRIYLVKRKGKTTEFPVDKEE
ncbi:hypothetical protein KQ51_00589 [Candidatus Izimaplasma bacterium HR1]|jgi:acetolactate synthase small subunit|uniref:DUF4349 domain-containing protein n=1 Tax=Candidatus Izimoplasma sp. HR1 TaxID=1541959 RepID=UPI0004F6ECDF|nr:hypothetical protein KQ51_00589 [Candidatus Izimaplasma bacterium HR1]